MNPYLGLDGLALLRQRLCAEDVLAFLRRADPAIESRQLGIIDAAGRTAAFTGSECTPWAGALARENLTVQGNRLAGPAVLEAAAAAFAEHAERPLAERLIEGLVAGDAAGGDRHEEESAAVFVVDLEDYPLWDVRVDHNPTPLIELRRLHQVFRERVLPEVLRMPTRANPAGSPDEHDA